MSGDLIAVREIMSGNLVKVREISGIARKKILSGKMCPVQTAEFCTL